MHPGHGSRYIRFVLHAASYGLWALRLGFLGFLSFGLWAFIARLAETPFGFCTSAFLPIPPQTPKHLEFGVFMPSKLRRDTLFGLKMPASWRNEKKTDFFIFRWSYFSAV
jgi:hypothetical protein